MPRRKQGSTSIDMLDRIGAKNQRTAGHVLASMIRQHGEAGAAERLGIARGSMNRLKLEAGVHTADVCFRNDEAIHIVHSDLCKV